MSTIQTDFDRIALASPDGATHNDHYHNYLLRHLPVNLELEDFNKSLRERGLQLITQRAP